MGASNQKRSGWIYIGAAVAICLVALVIWHTTEQASAPDPFTVKLEDLLNETPGISQSPENGFAFPVLEAFCSSLDEAGIMLNELERSGTTVAFKLTGEGFLKDDRLVCTINGAGQVTSFTLELLIAEKPKTPPSDATPLEEYVYERLLKKYEAFRVNMGLALNACLEAFGADAVLSYAACDRMHAAAEAAVADKKADTLKEDAFTFSVLFRDRGEDVTVHLSIERITKSSKGDGA